MQRTVDLNLSDGLLEHASTSSQDSFRFSHDRVQEAADALIPEGSKSILQWHIGKALVTKLTEVQLKRILFVVVDLLNAGLGEYESTHADNSKELLLLAKMNAQAGSKAMSVSAYRLASGYFLTGIKAIVNVSGGLELAWMQVRTLMQCCNCLFLNVSN